MRRGDLDKGVSLIRKWRNSAAGKALAVGLEGSGVLAEVLVADAHQGHHRALLVPHTHRHLHNT